MRRIGLVVISLVGTLAAALSLATFVAARPLPQLALNGIEPTVLVSQDGGTLSIYGGGFTTATVVRLVDVGCWRRRTSTARHSRRWCLAASCRAPMTWK